MSRKLFAAGCWVLIATGLAHSFGHYAMMGAQGDTEAEKQLLSLMRANPQDMGLGFVRSMFDILAGFSLTLRSCRPGWDGWAFSCCDTRGGRRGFSARRRSSTPASTGS